MTQSQLTKIKENIIRIPSQFKKYWENEEVYIRFSPESIYVKKIKPKSFWQIREELKEVAKSITQKDINKAVSWARKKTKQAR